MSLGHGASIITNGLVLYYDAGNVLKSWKGAPATNLFTETDLNNWSKSANVTTSTFVTPFDTPAYEIQDDSTSGYESVGRDITVANNTASYTISLFVKKTTGGTSARLGFNSGFNTGGTTVALNQRFNSDTGVATSGTVIDYGDWWYWYFTLSNNGTGNTNLYCVFYPATGPHDSSDNATAIGTAIVGGFMLVSGSTAARFASGTRSNTQALLDLTGRNLITTNALTYASNNTFTFNGTSDFIDSGYDMSWNNTNSATISMFLRPDSLTTGRPFIGKTDYEWQMNQLNQSLEFVYWNTTGGHTNGPIITVSNFFTSTTSFVHLTLVWNHVDNNIYIYRNGTLVNTSAWVNASINRNIAETVKIGGNVYIWGMGGSYWPGKIDIVSMYSRALSAAEVVQNYNALRGRYDI